MCMEKNMDQSFILFLETVPSEQQGYVLFV
jgi:hypothetical protein